MGYIYIIYTTYWGEFLNKFYNKDQSESSTNYKMVHQNVKYYVKKICGMNQLPWNSIYFQLPANFQLFTYEMFLRMC